MEIYFDYKDEFEAYILTKYNEILEDGKILITFLEKNNLIKVAGEKIDIENFFDKVLNMQADLSIYQLFSNLVLNYILDGDESIEQKILKLQKLPKYKFIASNIDIFSGYFLHEKKYYSLKYSHPEDIKSIILDLQKIFGDYFSFDFERSKFVFVDYGNHFDQYKIFAKYIIENF